MIVLDVFTLSIIVVAATEVLKLAFNVPKNWQPLLSVALAFGLGGSAGFWGFTDISMGEALLAGFAAAGLWDFGKNPTITAATRAISIVKSTKVIALIKSIKDFFIKKPQV